MVHQMEGGGLVSSKSMDMWSVGVCLMEIASGEGSV